MKGLDALDQIVTDKKPSSVEQVYHLFWEKGIDYTAFSKLPIPYILGILKAHNYIEREKDKAYRKKR